MRRTSTRRRVGLAAVIGMAATLAATAAVAADGDRSESIKQAIDSGQARNVILLIGDGMGDHEITIGRNYLVGAGGRLALDEVPLTGQMTTYSVLETNPAKPDYTPESASTATAWATGQKTSDGRISTSPGTDRDLPTILELAQRAGFRTGNVATSEISDATPAALMAHVRFRSCQGPQDMAPCPQDKKSAGGPGSIAEQSVDKGVNVILGGGKARYDQVIDGGPYTGKTVIQSAAARGYQVVTDKASMQAASGEKVLGLFNPSNLSVEFTGLPAAKPASGPQRCLENQRPANEPSLAEMTTKALELLTKPQQQHQRRRRPDKGFFLQVESASIDKRDHVSQACEQIGETKNMDEAVRVALEFAAQNEDTLVIVTADHAHTSQIVENSAVPAGFSTKLITADGEIMQVTYGTGSTPTSQGHTGSQVRVAAQGPQAANVIGLIDQTDLFDIMRRALGVGGGEHDEDDT